MSKDRNDRIGATLCGLALCGVAIAGCQGAEADMVDQPTAQAITEAPDVDTACDSTSTPTAGMVILYQHTAFGGACWRVTVGAGVVGAIPWVGERGIYNDQITTLKIGPHTWVGLYEHAGFGGKKLILPGGYENDAAYGWDVGPDGFNDKTSSLRVTLEPTPPPDQPPAPPAPSGRGQVTAIAHGQAASQIGCGGVAVVFSIEGGNVQSVTGSNGGGFPPFGTVFCNWAASWLSIPAGARQVCAAIPGAGDGRCGTANVVSDQRTTIEL